MGLEHRRAPIIKELRSLAIVRQIDGVLVDASCYAIRAEERIRYEIRLVGHGEHAVVDVADGEDLELRRNVAIRAFAAAVKARAAQVRRISTL